MTQTQKSKALAEALKAIDECFSAEMQRKSREALDFYRAVELALAGRGTGTQENFIAVLIAGRAALHANEQALETTKSKGEKISLAGTVRAQKTAFAMIEAKLGFAVTDLNDSNFEKTMRSHAATLLRPAPHKSGPPRP